MGTLFGCVTAAATTAAAEAVAVSVVAADVMMVRTGRNGENSISPVGVSARTEEGEEGREKRARCGGRRLRFASWKMGISLRRWQIANGAIQKFHLRSAGWPATVALGVGPRDTGTNSALTLTLLAEKRGKSYQMKGMTDDHQIDVVCS